MNNFLNLPFSKKLIVAGGVIAVLSLFLHWAVWEELTSYNGFQMHMYLVLIAFIYPVGKVLEKKYMKKKTAVISLAAGLVAVGLIRFIFELGNFSTWSHVSYGAGRNFMVIAIIISLAGVLMNKEVNQENK